MQDATQHDNQMTTTETHRKAAENYFLSLADIEQIAYMALDNSTSEWQFHRDRYVNLSNAAARLMGESIPFQDWFNQQQLNPQPNEKQKIPRDP